MIPFTESALSNLYSQFVNAGERPFAVLTAFKASRVARDTPPLTQHQRDVGMELNRGAIEDLEQDIRSMGYGYTRLQGNYGLPEPSLWVSGLPQDRALSLARKYQQDSVVYAGPETGGEVRLVYSTGGYDKLGTFHNKTGEYGFSALKGKPFVFEADTLADRLVEEKTLRPEVDGDLLKLYDGGKIVKVFTVKRDFVTRVISWLFGNGYTLRPKDLQVVIDALRKAS